MKLARYTAAVITLTLFCLFWITVGLMFAKGAIWAWS